MIAEHRQSVLESRLVGVNFVNWLDLSVCDKVKLDTFSNLAFAPLQVVELDVPCHSSVVVLSVLLDKASANVSLICLQLPDCRLDRALGPRQDLGEHFRQVFLGLCVLLSLFIGLRVVLQV